MSYHVQVKLFANLGHFFSKDLENIQIQPKATIRNLMNIIGIDPKEVKLIFINGVAKQINSELHNGDRVGLFPPIGGG